MSYDNIRMTPHTSVYACLHSSQSPGTNVHTSVYVYHMTSYECLVIRQHTYVSRQHTYVSSYVSGGKTDPQDIRTTKAIWICLNPGCTYSIGFLLHTDDRDDSICVRIYHCWKVSVRRRWHVCAVVADFLAML